MPRNYRTQGGDPRFRKAAHAFFDAQAVSRRAAAQKRVVRKTAVTKTWKSKVDRLLSGHRKDATDIARWNAGLALNTVHSFCMTSSDVAQTGGTGANGGGRAQQSSGLLFGDGDQAAINQVRIFGSAFLNNDYVTSVDGLAQTKLRMMLIWFEKPATSAVAGGNLPLIGEVMDPAWLNVWGATYGQNRPYSNKFTVLSNKVYDLGSKLHDSTTVLTAVCGKNYHKFDYTVKINKQCKFKFPASSSTGGGYFDSDDTVGQIGAGLCVLYVFSEGPEIVNFQCHTRLTYTM